METNTTMKLDYSLKTAEERSSFVADLLIDYPEDKKLTERYLEILADYVVTAMTAEQKAAKAILTDNRMITVNKRETSYQGLVDKFENGEDGVWNITINDKNVFLTHKKEITEEDLAAIPPLKSLVAAIQDVKKQLDIAAGKDKYTLKKQLIEMYQEQYIIKSLYKPQIAAKPQVRSIYSIDLGETIEIIDGEPVSDGLLSFFDEKHVCAILCNYSALVEDSAEHLTSDLYYLMKDFDILAAAALKDYPLYEKIVTYKIDGKQNLEIKELILQEFGISHTVEYISALWRKNIPKIIANKAKEEYLIWYYMNKEHGTWKTCSRCKETKLAHNRFFSKNSTSKDGFYSICKCCRNKKKGQ